MTTPFASGKVRLVLSDRRFNLTRPEARSALLAEHGFQADQLAWAEQVHGWQVAVVDEPGQVPKCDGLVTETPGIPLLLRFADCFPVVIADPKGAVAVLHAGWRGAVAGVVKAGAQALKELGYQPAHAWVGPGIRACCLEVGEEVALQFPDAFIRRGDRLTLDLAGFLGMQLTQSGIGRIDWTEVCTACRRDQYFSYRKEGPETGRHGALAWIQA